MSNDPTNDDGKKPIGKRGQRSEKKALNTTGCDEGNQDLGDGPEAKRPDQGQLDAQVAELSSGQP